MHGEPALHDPELFLSFSLMLCRTQHREEVPDVNKAPYFMFATGVMTTPPYTRPV